MRVLAWDDDPLHPLALAEKIIASVLDGRLQTLPSLMEFFKHPDIVGKAYGRMLTEISARAAPQKIERR